MSEVFPVRETPLGDVRLALRGLASGGRFRDVSFVVRSGESVGLAGLIGAGRTEVAKTIFGALPRTAGEVFVDGKPVNIRNSRTALRAGGVLVPEDRKLEGLILDFPIRQNVGLSIVAQTATLRTLVKRRTQVAVAKQASNRCAFGRAASGKSCGAYRAVTSRRSCSAARSRFGRAGSCSTNRRAEST